VAQPPPGLASGPLPLRLTRAGRLGALRSGAPPAFDPAHPAAAQVLATCEHEPTTVYAELDYGALLERRANMPLVQQRRLDLYSVVDKTA
jgi:predicted amidohydrolase